MKHKISRSKITPHLESLHNHYDYDTDGGKSKSTKLLASSSIIFVPSLMTVCQFKSYSVGIDTQTW